MYTKWVWRSYLVISSFCSTIFGENHLEDDESSSPKWEDQDGDKELSVEEVEPGQVEPGKLVLRGAAGAEGGDAQDAQEDHANESKG